ncbi:MAG: chorismate mutase [Eubacterium sp.]|nr:chorismate mutase [Eubacterium sp.]
MTIEEIRPDIDRIDSEMKDLFLERMQLIEKIALIKAESNTAVYNPAREAEIIESKSKDIDEQFKESYIQFVTDILNISKTYQNKRISEIRSE